MSGISLKIAAKKLVRVLEPFPIDLAVLFGSMARGQGHDGSDLDIGVLLRDANDTTRSRLAAALSRSAGKTVDIVYLDEAPPLLRFEIARDGVVLLEGSPHSWKDFRARAMIDWWDWAPTARMIHREVISRLKEKAAHGSS
ncbi:MAG: type VII toxin-antitoxin system MntA family adenylyltransferase antitoxin [Vicinamibacteria bacterium]